MDTRDYQALVKKRASTSPIFKNAFAAFWCGGLICTFGEALHLLFVYFGLSEKTALTLVTITLIFLAAVLTGVGIFDRIARYAGAGTLLPVTGFANAVASPAIDTKSEGFIMGVGTKIFSVAGPVILYATVAGTLWGVIYYFISLFS